MDSYAIGLIVVSMIEQMIENGTLMPGPEWKQKDKADNTENGDDMRGESDADNSTHLDS